MRTRNLLVLPIAVAALGLSACGGGKKDKSSDSQNGPQTGHGAILEAARKATDTANRQVGELEKQADRSGG